MDEGNRVPQRSRPRPYDLRRKVLLKNFLREQMTHIPLPPPRLPDDDAIADDEVSSTVGNEENIEHPANNIVQVESPPLPVPDPVPGTSSAEAESPDSSTSQEPDEEEDDNKNPKKPTFTRLSSLLRNKINTVRNRRKGITKAKLKMKSKIVLQEPNVVNTFQFKPAVKPKSLSSLKITTHQPRIANVTEKKPAVKPKSVSSQKIVLQEPKVVNTFEFKPAVKPKSMSSFFTMFKARRDMQRKKRETIRKKLRSPPPAPKTSTQSVQTDVSFTQDEFDTMEQSNRSLREENRLLSESLSSFMTDFDLKLSPLKIPYGTDSYITSAGTSQSQNTAQTSSGVPNRHLNYGDSPPRIKIPRSKSMQDRFDRRFPNRRTRSMNYGLTKRFYDSSSLQQPHPYRRNFNGETSNGFRHERQRPSSFSSFDSNLNRIPAPQSNFRMPPRRLPIVRNPSNANSNRAVVRRSSMPERSSYQPSRPILRHKSTRVRGYNHANGYHGQHNFNVINGNVPIRRRSSSNGDYGRPVPFQSLPPEAFY